jgi:site-specific recombinase XerD
MQNHHDPILDLFAAELAGTHAASTLARYAVHLNALAAALPEGVSLATCAEEHVRAYLLDREAAGIAARTRRQFLSAIRCLAMWGIRRGLRTDDPTRTIPWPKLPQGRGRPLSSTQLRALLSLLRAGPSSGGAYTAAQWERNELAICLMLYAGLRIAEVAALTWGHIDLAERLIYVENGKGGKDRALPMHRELVRLLRSTPLAERHGPVIVTSRGRAMSPFTLAHLFQRWLPAQGLDGLTAHALRRTCASLLRKSGADLETIRGVLGHASIATTELYLGPDPELLRVGVDSLPDIEALIAAPSEIRALPRTG